MTEKKLIAGCRQRVHKYQKALVEQYSGLLLTVARRYCAASVSPEDALLEAFIRILNNIDQFDPAKGSLEAWMKRIVINRALRKMERKHVSHELYVQEESHFRGPSVPPAVYEQLDAEDLLKLIAELPEGYRQVFNLSVIEGYNHHEIGKMLEINAASSRSNLSRAKQLLRKRINKQQNKCKDSACR